MMNNDQQVSLDIPAAAYRKVNVGLIFLRYISAAIVGYMIEQYLLEQIILKMKGMKKCLMKQY